MTNGKVTLGVGEVVEDSIVVVGVSSTPPVDVAVEEGFQVNGFRVVVVISAKTYEGVFVIQWGSNTEYPSNFFSSPARPCSFDLHNSGYVKITIQKKHIFNPHVAFYLLLLA